MSPLEIEIRCSECGGSLGWRSIDHRNSVEVPPCSRCVADAERKGEATGRRKADSDREEGEP